MTILYVCVYHDEDNFSARKTRNRIKKVVRDDLVKSVKSQLDITLRL